MELIGTVSSSLAVPLDPPITVRWFDARPRLFAAGLPVTPLNLALRGRIDHGQTRSSARAYVYALELFLSFLASRRLSLIGASNADFTTFTAALLGQPYRDGDGRQTLLGGTRTAATSQSLVARLYGIFGDLEATYGITFDWRRYRVAGRFGGAQVAERVHRYRVPAKEPLGLPDPQFGRLLERATELWADEITDGDHAFAADPEQQRGALLARNVAILMVLRFAGARRSEVAPIDLADIDRSQGLLQLATKGRAGGKEPVVLLPVVDAAVARYLLAFRPYGLRPFRRGARQRPRAVERDALFLSHSAHRYGERISDETVRGLIDRLRPALDPPWNRLLHPHALRHAFAHELQRVAGPFAASTNLRHRSLRSMDPYRGSVTQWAESLRQIDAAALDLLVGSGVPTR